MSTRGSATAVAAEPRTDPDPDAPGRRSRKKQQTRLALMAAGDQLFATQGFDETTTNDIAELADVSQRTLFRHFPTKEALLYGDMEDVLAELRAAFDARPADEPVLDAVHGAMLSLGSNFERHRERRLLQARLAARYPSVSAFSRAAVQLAWEREIVAAAAARLGVDPLSDPRPEVIAGASMSAVRVALRQWTHSNGRADFMRLIADALDAVGSLGTDTAVAPAC